MEETWRWFGPQDSTTLADVRQTGARGIVTALHHIPYGDVWSIEEIEKRKAEIAADSSLGLYWRVVESVPVSEEIKLGGPNLPRLYENYRQTLRNLAACGIHTVCYNFMPVLDWARTQLDEPLPGGATALRFNMHEYAAFDCYMLEREGAETEYSEEVIQRARAWRDAANDANRKRLLDTIMAGLPGAFDRYDIPGLREILRRYHGVTKAHVRSMLVSFLKEIIPVAEECGITMAIHPDDPPRPLFGLPRVVGNADDLDFIVKAVPSVSNGLTLCTGSLGAGAGNDLPAVAKRFAHHVHFAHLRNVTKDEDGSFMEADHLDGDVDIVAVVQILLNEQLRRRIAGEQNWRIPFRPDHGRKLLDDIHKQAHPGYPTIGRLRGLAELRGVMAALSAPQIGKQS
ncbi:mannonate dehydratase [Phyllobacterium brassicacearum]|uniref:Mannonate dehydratase n=1 Tax=Phyllobacterium brassicacearum TaxID=314235 RepID=A0A2P7BH10_9HYPH|nr:mannonate dehydratase [Phyllobacterium brassicacearum]PSH65781.1 mannonate dehydratase [Phyllobacterium brassicacearum]